MKKVLFVLTLALFAASQASAQMSDEEVIKFVQAEHEAGKSQQAILLDLQKKGVKKEQLLRLKEQYESGQLSNIPAASASSSVGSRTRKANGNIPERTGELVGNVAVATKEIFGHDIFQNEKLTFEPNMNIATPTSYILGPGDEVLIDVYGTSQSSKKYDVSPEGTIIVEKIGPVAVAGLTVEQAQAKVSAQMGQHYQGSSIKLTIGQTRTVVVNVLGEVVNPGTYTLSAFATVFNALYLAGGITELGTLRNILVSRNGKIVSKIDVYDYILNGKLTGNILLQDNDAIIVGTYDVLVHIKGAIKRPMYYEMKTDETLKALLTYAGGYRSEANKNVVTVDRKSDDGLKVHTVEEWDFANFVVQDGDIVSIKNIIGRYQNMVEVSGSVFYPGHYELSGDCNSVRTLIEKAGGIKEDAFTNRALLFRLTPQRTRKTISLDLAGILSGKVPDVILENEDMVAVASDEELIKSRQYTVFGPVLMPGTFPYIENMTLEDAIVTAGGLKEEALLSNVEVARRLQYTDERDTTYNTKVKIFTFGIDNGLLVNEGQNFLLKPYDIITIKRDPEYTESSTVSISGEVKYPGTYTLKSKTERLSDLVERAGGFTDASFIDGARFTRALTHDEREQAILLQKIAHSSDTVDIEKIEIPNRYSLGIDLAKAMKKPGCTEDPILRSGDQIVIPQRKNTVRISGDVLFPNTVTYVEKKSARYYLNQAGGVSNKGHRSKAFIIYANGQVSRLKKGKIQPGCEIVIPTRIEKKSDPQKTSMTLAGVGTLSTIGAVLISALRR